MLYQIQTYYMALSAPQCTEHRRCSEMWCSTSVPHRSITKPRWNKNQHWDFFLSSFCSTNYQRYSEPTWTTNGCKWVFLLQTFRNPKRKVDLALESHHSPSDIIVYLPDGSQSWGWGFPLSLTLSSSLSKKAFIKVSWRSPEAHFKSLSYFFSLSAFRIHLLM